MRELPVGWTRLPLSECAEFLDGKRVPVNADERVKRPGPVPYYGATGQVGSIDGYLFDEELLLVGEDGAPFFDKAKPIAYVIRGKSWVNNHAHVLRADTRITSNDFLKYYLDSFDFHDFVSGTTRLKLPQGQMRQIPVTVPPLAEQRRIVAEIEKQFTRLEEATMVARSAAMRTAQAQRSVFACALRTLKTIGFDSSVEYERLNSIIGTGSKKVPPDKTIALSNPHSWPVASLDQLTTRITSGSRDWSGYYGRGTGTFLLAQNVRPRKLDLSVRQSIDPPLNDASRERSAVSAGDLLVTIVGANTGDVCAVEQLLEEHYVCQSVALVRPKTPELTKYLAFYLSDDYFGRAVWKRYIYGAGRPHLSFDQLKKTPVLVPPVHLWTDLISQMDSTETIIQSAQEALKKTLDHAHRLRQSILAKAFSGRLVPQDPNDEPGSVLLERIHTNGSVLAAPKRSGRNARKRPEPALQSR